MYYADKTVLFARKFHARRGVVLMLVLVAVAIATTLAYSFISSQATTVSISRNVKNVAQARYIAESGLAIAISYVKNTITWRDDQSNGVWVTGASFGGGTYSITGEDGADTNDDDVISQPSEGDGDLSDDQEDLLTLTVTGNFGGATHTVRAVLAPQVTYSVEVLFVVSDASSLTAQDNAKKALMNGWGFSVEAISAGALQAEYDAALADADVAYVSNETSAAQVGTKLNIATIGVVVEQVDLSNDMGASSSAESYTGAKQINVTDNSHYLTETLGSGALSITTNPTELIARTGALAPGLNTLATRTANGDSALDCLDAGASLYGGGTAAGRRVFLPWGGYSFDIGLLTEEGKTLMKRSIEWGAGIEGMGASSFGYSTAYGLTQNASLNKTRATQVTLAEPMTVTAISAYVKGPPPKSLRYAVYADDGGSPGALIVESAVGAINSNVFYWQEIAVPPTDLPAGDYWLAVTFERTNMYYSYETGGSTHHSGVEAVGGFPANWGVSAELFSRKMSIYAIGEVSSGGGAGVTGYDVRWRD